MTIRKSVTLAAICVTLLVAAALILVARASNARIESRVALAVTTDRTLIWGQVVERLFDKMASGIAAFDSDFTLRQAIKAHDADELQHAVAALTNLISEQGYFEQLYIFDAAAQQLCCGTTPLPPDVRALSQLPPPDEQPLRRIGRNAQGEPVALLAFRLFVRHAPIGVIVLRQPLHSALERFKTVANSEVALASASGQLFLTTAPERLPSCKSRCPCSASGVIRSSPLRMRPTPPASFPSPAWTDNRSSISSA